MWHLCLCARGRGCGVSVGVVRVGFRWAVASETACRIHPRRIELLRGTLAEAALVALVDRRPATSQELAGGGCAVAAHRR